MLAKAETIIAHAIKIWGMLYFVKNLLQRHTDWHYLLEREMQIEVEE